MFYVSKDMILKCNQSASVYTSIIAVIGNFVFNILVKPHDDRWQIKAILCYFVEYYNFNFKAGVSVCFMMINCE